MREMNQSSSGESNGASGRPIYHGGNTRALYYGGSARPVYYGGGSPAAYGGSSYGGAYYGDVNGSGGNEGESLIGAITIGRMLRVCTQRWVTIAVFTIIGVVAACAVFKISPTVYEAESVSEMNLRRPSYLGTRQMVGMDADFGSPMDEVFNTRLARLRSRAMIEAVIRQFRTDYPSSQATDEELVKMLVDSKMTLQRRSRLIRLSARSTDKQLAADVVNAYAKTAEQFTSDLSKSDSDTMVAWLTNNAEEQRRALERMNKEMMDFRSANQLDLMASENMATQQALDHLNTEILKLEGEITRDTELLKTLETIQSDPQKFGSLPEAVPRSSEIGVAYQMLQKVMAEKNAMLARYTAQHPDVKVMEKQVEVYANQFADVVARAYETCKANLDFQQRQLGLLSPKRNELMRKLSDLELKIVLAKMKIEQMVQTREVGDISYKDLLQRKREAELASDENTAIIKLVESAAVPANPVLPNPLIIFSAGPAIGLILGILFVLVLDHLEDKIAGISDIEQRLHLKTLAVLPHVRRKKREQLARLVSEDKFSQFAEAVAGLRNLLDSPRYQEMSKVLLCMSTQPGEGKTITSCSLAASCAQSGQRTLLVDFDMRRPRLARIFDKTPEDFNSLPHTLAMADPAQFATLPIPSGVENLDVILSKASSEISPANLMGSGIIVEFFTWARQHYDRVVIESPPFGIVGDVMTLASLADAVMIMCCPDRTRFQPIKHAARHLTESGARIIGMIVNDVDFGRRNQFSKYDYHYRYAYGYASRYGQPKKNVGEEAEDRAAVAAATRPVYGDDLAPSASASVARQDVVDASMTDDE